MIGGKRTVAIGKHLRAAGMLALGLATAGCDTMSGIQKSIVGGGTPEGTPGYVSGFLGGVVADEPRAALIAREVLSSGGTAADAAVALGFALSVTLPSRAGLGGGGACIAYDPDTSGPARGMPEAVLFVPAASDAPGGDRPAAVPLLARGLFALHARYGKRPFESLVAPAEQMARFGVPVSRAFAADIAAVAQPLFADPNARAVFSHNGTPLAEGEQMTQPELGATLAQLRTSGVGDLYIGGLGRKLEQASPLAGGPVTLAALRAALPRFGAPITLAVGRDQVSFLPPPADGGLAAAAAFKVLRAQPGDVSAAQSAAAAAVLRWRSGGGDPMAILAAPAGGGTLPVLPASTSFATLDRNGHAVACAISMNNLFGTGRIVPGMGFLLAASPAAVPPPLLAAGIAWNSHLDAFRVEAGGSGQEGAGLAVASAIDTALRTGRPMAQPVPEPGRANVIACAGYLPGSEGSCGWAADPRGAGLAVGSN